MKWTQHLASVAALAVGAAAPVAHAFADAPATGGKKVFLMAGCGTTVTLPSPMTDLFVGDDKVADVQVRSPLKFEIVGKALGETTVFVISGNRKVIYSAVVLVGAKSGACPD